MKTYIPVQPLLLCICLLALLRKADAQATVQTGKSYVNITKGLNGGTIEPGDTLEIRATIAVSAGNITRVHYVDTIPANTTYIPGSLKILTNEGLSFKSYTDASGDDPAYFNPAGYLRINLGSTYNNGGAVNLGGNCTNTAPWSAPDGGTIQSNRGRPSFFGNTCILSASFRVEVNTGLAYGTLINIRGGSFYFRNNSSVNQSRSCSPYQAALKANAGLCPNAIGANAVIDYGGTFGSGFTQNRAVSAIVPGFIRQNVATSQPNDGYYCIVNNLSPSGNTDPNSPIPNGTNRVHSVWDIMGDHTGATDPLAGNLPVAPGANGGYFVAINAAYANSNAIEQTIGGLCPNTYYEFSAWFKNVCKYCGCDSTGDPSYNNGIPNTNFNGPDSSGVNPNLTFVIDGVDYYTSGNLKYTGQWVKKGFVYLTGPAQTAFTITIRNNAAGGGGNDWAIDDVTLATCTPNLDLQPSPSMQVCMRQAVDMFANIRCYFPNYIHWRWERSTDGGATWSNTGVSGTGNPQLNAGEYEYRAEYPTFLADSSIDNVRYRIRIASTVANLDNNSCSFVAGTHIQLTSQSCDILPLTDILFFSGKQVNGLANLQWTTGNEVPGTIFEIESSNNRVHFTKVGTIQANFNSVNTYHFTDPALLTRDRYYRIRVRNEKTFGYSKIIMLSNGEVNFTIKSLVNPFRERINFELITPADGPAIILLMDTYGRPVKQMNIQVQKGFNVVDLTKLDKLPAGVYIMQVQQQEQVITKRLIKSGP